MQVSPSTLPVSSLTQSPSACFDRSFPCQLAESHRGTRGRKFDGCRLWFQAHPFTSLWCCYEHPRRDFVGIYVDKQRIDWYLRGYWHKYRAPTTSLLYYYIILDTFWKSIMGQSFIIGSLRKSQVLLPTPVLRLRKYILPTLHISSLPQVWGMY